MKRFGVTVNVDRPIGYKDFYGNVYKLNYGYIKGITAGDGEAQDAYIIYDKNEPLEIFKGEVMAVVVRKYDIEDKWVVGKWGDAISESEILNQINFLEKHFDSEIVLLD